MAADEQAGGPDSDSAAQDQANIAQPTALNAKSEEQYDASDGKRYQRDEGAFEELHVIFSSIAGGGRQSAVQWQSMRWEPFRFQSINTAGPTADSGEEGLSLTWPAVCFVAENWTDSNSRKNVA